MVRYSTEQDLLCVLVHMDETLWVCFGLFLFRHLSPNKGVLVSNTADQPSTFYMQIILMNL